MIHLLHLGTVTVAYCMLGDTPQKSRRQKEREAVVRILRHLYGDRYRLEHDSQGAPVLVRYIEEKDKIDRVKEVERNERNDGNERKADENPCISISHSRNLAMVACHASKRIGIDTETLRPSLAAVATRFLTEEERTFCNTSALLLRAWTIKEAVYKASPAPSADLTDIKIDPSFKRAVDSFGSYTLNTLEIEGNTVTLSMTND